MNPSFDYFAYYYLNQWLAHDRCFTQKIVSKDKVVRLRGFQDACKFYRVSRNLFKKYDEGKGYARYEPALDIFDCYEYLGSDAISTQLNIEHKVSEKYGHRSVLSLTTKLCWLKFRSPVVVYDSRAKVSLGYKGNDLKEYSQIWHKEYAKFHNEIVASCNKLDKLSSYVVNNEVGDKQYIHELSKESWFHERVFDMYLWYHGE